MRTPRRASTPVSATRSVLALLTIPVLSVSSAAAVGDVANSNDPQRVVWGLVAMVAGTLAGLGMVRLADSVVAGIAIVIAALATWWRGPVWATGLTPSAVRESPSRLMVSVVGLAPIQRRGPPFRFG